MFYTSAMAFFSTLAKAVKSRTIWAGAASTAIGGFELVTTYAPQILPFVPATSKVAAILTVIAGIGAIVARLKARQPIGPVIDKTIADTIAAGHVLGITDKPETLAGKVAQVQTVAEVVKAKQSI